MTYTNKVFHNIYSNSRYESGKFRRLERILPRINRLFGDPLCRAKDLNVSVKINMTPVIDARGLAGEIAKRRLENDRATLGLFLKAINITNKKAAKIMDKSDISYLLDLGKLLPAKLKIREFEQEADDFRETRGQKKAFEILTKMDVIYPVVKFESPFKSSSEI